MNSLAKKIASVGLSVTTAVWLTGAAAFVPVASAQTAADLQAQISALLATIQALQAQLAGMTGAPASYTFTRDLTVGSRGDDVKALQQYLNSQGYQVAASGVGSPGSETTYFGPLTQAALAKFQAAKGVTPSVGYFGPKTRASIGAVAGPGAPVVPVPAGAAATVDAIGPAAGTIPDGSIYNPVLKLRFTAGASAVNVSSVTVTRGGYIANTMITGLSAWDDAAVRYGNIVTALTSDGKATLSFGTTPFSVPAGQSKVLTIAANIDALAGSGSVSFSVAAASDINVGGTVSGTFPITGSTFTVVDGSTSLADIRLSDQAVSGMSSANAQNSAVDGNVEIGTDVQKEVFKLRLNQNNSREGVKLEKLSFYVSGTIDETKDLRNWKLYSPEGNVLATADRSYDRNVNFVLATPYLIDKGLSKDLSVKVDVTDGSSRYFTLYIMNDYDVTVRGVTTGAGIVPADSTGGALAAADTQANAASAYFKMKAGDLTVSKAASSPSGSVAPSSQNVVLAEFDLKSAGEKLEIRKMGVKVLYPGASAVVLTGSLSVKDKATNETYLSISADTTGIVTSTVPTAAYLLTGQQNLSSYITVESGETKTIQVIGTVSSNATSTSNYTVYVGQFYSKRFSTNDYMDLAAAAYSANQIAVGDVTLSVTKDVSFVNTNRAAGATNVKIGQYVFQASAADDVRISTVNVGVYATSTNTQNVKLVKGTTWDAASQIGATVGTPSVSGNSFTVNLTIPKSASQVISVFADVLASGVGNVSTSIMAAGVSGYGIASGKSLASTPAALEGGQIVLIAAPTLTITKDPDSAVSKVVTAGGTGVELGKIRFLAANDSLTLKTIRLEIISASTSQWAAATDVSQNFQKVYLYDGSAPLNAGGTSVASGEVLISGLSLALPQGQYKTLTVKADVSNSGTMKSDSVGGIQVKSTTSPTDLEVYSAQGLMTSGVTLTGNASSSFMLFADTAPTIANAYDLPTTGKGAMPNDVISKFRITNPGPVPITLTSTTIAVTLAGTLNTSSSVGQFTLTDVNDFTLATAPLQVSATSTSASFTFSSFAQTQEISAGGSKVLVLKADTSNIKTGTITTGIAPSLSTRVDGTKGYIESSRSSELMWNDGGLMYSYVTATQVTNSNNQASDSYTVYGSTLFY